MPHSWSLASEFQLYLLGLLVCILIIYKKRCGLILLFTLAAASVLATFFKIYLEERPPMLLFYPNLLKDQEFQVTYTKTHLRAAPYFIGLYAGYFYHKHYGTKKRLSVVHDFQVINKRFPVLTLKRFADSVSTDKHHFFCCPFRSGAQCGSVLLSKPGIQCTGISNIWSTQ